MRLTTVLMIAFASLGTLTGAPGRAAAADEGTPNACGCRQTAVGSCVCDRKAKCGCPGECEPKGCDEKRAKLLEKEIQAETKKAADADRKREMTSTEERAPAARTARVEAAPAVHEPKAARAKKMTGAQKKDLARLLDLYVGENPDHRNWTIEKVDDDLTP